MTVSCLALRSRLRNVTTTTARTATIIARIATATMGIMKACSVKIDKLSDELDARITVVVIPIPLMELELLVVVASAVVVVRRIVEPPVLVLRSEVVCGCAPQICSM